MVDRTIEEKVFVGRPFMGTMMDERRTFTQTNMEMENDETLQKFLKDNNLENRRSVLIVYGPENFMYWYGILVDPDVEVPNGLMKYVLPKAEIAEEKEDGNLSSFSLPLNYIVPNFFDKLEKRGIKVFANPGDSETPYLIQDLDMDAKKLTKIWYLKASK